MWKRDQRSVSEMLGNGLFGCSDISPCTVGHTFLEKMHGQYTSVIVDDVSTMHKRTFFVHHKNYWGARPGVKSGLLSNGASRVWADLNLYLSITLSHRTRGKERVGHSIIGLFLACCHNKWLTGLMGRTIDSSCIHMAYGI